MTEAEQHDRPWRHWIADDWLSPACLHELKHIAITHDQQAAGRRRDSVRTFVTEQDRHRWPRLAQLYQDLQGPRREWFEHYTGLDYRGLYLRLEVISDIGPFHLEPHTDHREKRLTAFVYTDHARLWPGTMLSQGHRIQSRDNRCFFFVPDSDTWHSYPVTEFDQVRRCLQINYWTVPS